MYGLCFEGLSGLDDGIEEYIVKNGARYAPPAKDMLEQSTSESREEDIAQYFIELSNYAIDSKR